MRIFLEVGRIHLRIPKEIRPHSQLQMLASSLDRLAKHEQTAGAPEFKFTGLSSALPTLFPERQLTKGAIYESWNVIKESSKVDDNIGRCTLCSRDMHVAGPPPKGVGPECKLAYSAGLQPVPAWDSPVRFEFRTSQGSGGGGFHRKSSDCPMAGLSAPDSDGSAPNIAEYGN